jgi:hypothetical protein
MIRIKMIERKERYTLEGFTEDLWDKELDNIEKADLGCVHPSQLAML